MERKKYFIDAKGRVLGRLATEIAILLRGKGKANFQPNKDMGDFVIVKNVSLLKFTGKKLEKKKYYHHSGYMGGLKVRTLKELFEKRPEEVLRKAVLGMMPKNKLRRVQIKRLNFE